MAKSNGIHFFLFVLFFTFAILPAHGLHLILSTGDRSVANICNIDNGGPDDSYYNCTEGTTEIIYYAVNSVRFDEVMNPQFDDERLSIKTDLAMKHHELFYLQVADFVLCPDNVTKIREFLLDRVCCEPCTRDHKTSVIVDECFGTTPDHRNHFNVHTEESVSNEKPLKQRLNEMRL